MWTWDDAHVCAMDYETSGVRPEFALQPWRIPRGEAWVTSLAWVWPQGRQLQQAGGVMPDPDLTRQFLEWAIAEDRVVCGWNPTFDVSVAMALGFRDLCMKVRWLDGRLLWRHLAVEPEYDEKRHLKKSYGLKDWVREFMPEQAGYEAEIDFHDASPEALRRLQTYNVLDNAFTLRACKRLWGALEPRQRAAAWIEAASIPLVADANLRGLLIDTIACGDLTLTLQGQADAIFDQLTPSIAPHLPPAATPKERRMSERERAAAVIASPLKLAWLLFDVWGLPVQKLNPPNQKGEQTRSTDKEVLFELAFMDGRAKLLRQYREAHNCSKKFAQTPRVAADYNGDGRAHPSAIMFGTYSGRFTYASKQTRKKKRDDDGAIVE